MIILVKNAKKLGNAFDRSKLPKHPNTLSSTLKDFRLIQGPKKLSLMLGIPIKISI